MIELALLHVYAESFMCKIDNIFVESGILRFLLGFKYFKGFNVKNNQLQDWVPFQLFRDFPLRT